MSAIDIIIFVVYLLAMLSVGAYFLFVNQSEEDYYVGGRNLGAWHIGLSVVATDVGGGFSIGLGGLGFAVGLSGSWMLFTGLLGAWLASVYLIPKVFDIAKNKSLLSFPEALAYFYNKKVAAMAAIVSLVGYIGFTSSQLLAGAKLASATFPDVSLTTIIIIMGAIAVVYTSMGGIKAVIYTDTVQWIILLLGLVCIGIPLGYLHLGGWEKISSILPASYFKLNQVGAVELFNWALTIIPIWFVGMTLYQRIYSAGSQKTAIRAWRIAGWFEWPVMAFMGVVLGVFAKAAYLSGEFSAMGYLPTDPMDAELGLPLFLKHILPVGLLGLMMSAYFSAILSTADSCLMAASGNMHTDILRPLSIKLPGKNLRQSQLISLVLGVLAVFIAIKMTSVLELMLYSYAFMVSGLLVPVLAMLVLKKPSPLAAVYAIISGGLSTLVLIGFEVNLPYGLDANFFGIAISLFTFTSIHFIQKKFNGIYNP